MRKNDVIFKGTREGLHLVINAERSIEEIKKVLIEKLDEAKKFYKGANVTLEPRGAVVSSEVIKEVKTLLETNGLSVSVADEDLLSKMREERARFQTARATRTTKEWSSPVVRGLEMERLPLQADTIMVKRTLRAGQCISFDGNVVIMGDVNSGAEVEATCDIVVWGTLRGIAHAGAAGDTNSKVVALRLMASQLRIANKITRAPDGVAHVPTGPEIAMIKDDSIVIEPWTSHSGVVFD